MTADEQAIRALVARWMGASREGDLPTVLDLMADDALFMTPGRAPFGKDAFAAMSAEMAGVKFEGDSEIVEVQVIGGWAWLRNRIQVVITPSDGTPCALDGHTLTILRKESDGRWVLFRDANLVMPANG